MPFKYWQADGNISLLNWMILASLLRLVFNVFSVIGKGPMWSFNPFRIKRSAGVGVRIFLPMIGLLGLDWGYGFDNPVKENRSQLHFVIGQQF